MSLAITGIYAAVLGIMFIALWVNVIIERAKPGISIMHQDNLVLAEKIRRFGNFVEVVPHALILMRIAETFGTSPDLAAIAYKKAIGMSGEKKPRHF